MSCYFQIPPDHKYLMPLELLTFFTADGCHKQPCYTLPFIVLMLFHLCSILLSCTSAFFISVSPSSVHFTVCCLYLRMLDVGFLQIWYFDVSKHQNIWSWYLMSRAQSLHLSQTDLFFSWLQNISLRNRCGERKTTFHFLFYDTFDIFNGIFGDSGLNHYGTYVYSNDSQYVGH